MDWGSHITYLASTAFKERVVPFGIKDEDRLKHLCILGKVGSGRAELLTRMSLQDAERSLGLLVLDATGNLGPLIMERLNAEQLTRLVHLDASDAEYPFSIDFVGEFRKTEKGKKLFPDVVASVYGVPRDPLVEFLADYTLQKTDATILTLFTILTDEKERASAVVAFTEKGQQLTKLLETHKDTIAKMSENGRYLVKDTMVRNQIGQKEGKFSFTSLHEGSIVIVDLSRIRIFPTRIGPLVKLFSYAFRAATDDGRYASLYLHDCLRYFTELDATELMADRSFALTLSDTVYRESDLPLREKVLAQCGSVVAFEPHQSDVPLVEKLFYPYVQPEEIQGLEAGESCVQLSIDAVRAKPFFANSLQLPERLNVSLQDIMVDARKKYTTPRTQVDQIFKKQDDKDKKDGQPPFSDAFKNIFAKRDPAKALQMGEKKPDPSKPQAETGVQQAVAAALVPPLSATHTEPPKQTATVVQVQADVSPPREVPEQELRELLYVSPLPV